LRAAGKSEGQAGDNYCYLYMGRKLRLQGLIRLNVDEKVSKNILFNLILRLNDNLN
jgi:hypothetical protein